MLEVQWNFYIQFSRPKNIFQKKNGKENAESKWANRNELHNPLLNIYITTPFSEKFLKKYQKLMVFFMFA